MASPKGIKPATIAAVVRIVGTFIVFFNPVSRTLAQAGRSLYHVVQNSFCNDGPILMLTIYSLIRPRPNTPLREDVRAIFSVYKSKSFIHLIHMNV
jgi:hypothetical protein